MPYYPDINTSLACREHGSQCPNVKSVQTAPEPSFDDGEVLNGNITTDAQLLELTESDCINLNLYARIMLARRTGDTESALTYYKHNMRYILSCAPIRTLVSLLDTYADDTSDPSRRAAAVAVCGLVRTERLARRSTVPDPALDKMVNRVGGCPSYPGHHENFKWHSLVCPDAMLFTFRRLRAVLDKHIYLWNLAYTILEIEFKVADNIFNAVKTTGIRRHDYVCSNHIEPEIRPMPSDYFLSEVSPQRPNAVQNKLKGGTGWVTTPQVVGPMPRARELWIYTQSGLCNRWLALCSALAVCQRDDRRLVICWSPEVERFTSAHKGAAKFSVRTNGPDLQPHVMPDRVAEDAEGFFCPQASFSDLWSNNWAQVPAKTWNALGPLAAPWEESPGEAHRVKVAGFSFFCEELIEGIGEYANQFTPSKPVQALIDKWAPTIDEAEQIVGVSIRTIRPHPVTCDRSPIESFITNLSAYFQRFPKAEVFVSAEEEWVAPFLAYHFPDRAFHSQHNPYEFQSKESMQKALADLYLLARTDHIIGSEFSTFSGMAHTLKTGVANQFTSPGCDTRPAFPEPEPIVWGPENIKKQYPQLF